MKNLLDNLISFCVGAIFILCIVIVTDYHQYQAEAEASNENYTIPSNLAYVTGNFNFSFTNRTELMRICDYPNQTIIGCTTKDERIWIATDLSKYDTWTTCNHEVLHNLIRVSSKGTDWEHQYINPLESHVALPVCYELINNSTVKRNI